MASGRLLGRVAAGMVAVLMDWRRGSRITDKGIRIAVVSHIRDVLGVVEEL
ncbi:MAG: hypothetical protein QXJ48_04790 [Candidatus Korarchaeum sp.]